MIANDLQRNTNDFPCLAFPPSKFVNEFNALKGPKLSSAFERIDNPELMRALIHFEEKPLQYLLPEDNGHWRGVVSYLKNSAGDQYGIWRLARRVTYEGKPYTLNLHFTPGEIEMTPSTRDLPLRRETILPIDECRPHQHPFGDIAVAVHEGAYFMGLGRPDQPIADFEWGMITAGNCYFMSADLQHGTVPLSPFVISVMLHEKVSRREIEKNEFAGINEMPDDEKAVLLDYFRNVFARDFKLHVLP